MRAVRVITLLGGLFFLSFGLWAFLGPRSFFDRIATYAPYNPHLIHDLGAFQLGIGATLLLALVWTDALLAALAGASAGGILHFSAHVQDRHLGGRTSDPASIGVIAALLVVGAVLQARAVGRKGAG